MVQKLNFVVSQYKYNKQITSWLVHLYDFYLRVVKNHKWMNYAQDFGNWVKNPLKELRIRGGLHSWKVKLSHVKYFHAFVSTLNYVSPIGANNDKRR